MHLCHLCMWCVRVYLLVVVGPRVGCTSEIRHRTPPLPCDKILHHIYNDNTERQARTVRPGQEGHGAGDGDGLIWDDGGHALYVRGEVAVAELHALGLPCVGLIFRCGERVGGCEIGACQCAAHERGTMETIHTHMYMQNCTGGPAGVDERGEVVGLNGGRGDEGGGVHHLDQDKKACV